MANIAQSVNVISPLMTTPDGLMKQTTWWPFLLFCKYMRGWTIATHVSSPAYEGPTEPAWLQAAAVIPWLDVSATINEEGWVSMVVINLHPTENFEVDVEGVKAGRGEKVKVYTVTGEKWDVTNTSEKQSVGIEESEWDGEGKFKFPRMSVVMLRWKP